MNLDVNAGGTVNNTVLTRFYDAPPLNRREILRYAGCSEVPDKEILAVLDECLEEIRDRLSYKVCYSEFLLKYSAFKGACIQFARMPQHNSVCGDNRNRDRQAYCKV